MSGYTDSAQNFVRALRAPSDPPQPGEPLKIKIATEIWNNADFYVLNKNEVIADFILTQFAKDKAKILDVQYWSLLYEVATCSHNVSSGRLLKIWLVPLLNRVSLPTVVITLLNHVPQIPTEHYRLLIPVFGRCFPVIWSLGIQKSTTEVLMDCFGAVLAVLAKCDFDEDLCHISSIIISSFRTAFGRTSNKKKFFPVMLQNHLKNWLVCINHSLEETKYCPLLGEVYIGGVELLFNGDILRQSQVQDSKSLQDLLDSLGAVQPSSVVLSALPRLYLSLVQATQKNRSVLFDQDSNHSSLNEMRAYGMKQFVAFQGITTTVEDKAQIWCARRDLLSILYSERLYVSSQFDCVSILRDVGEQAVEELISSWKPERLSNTIIALDVLSVLVNIDYDIISPLVPRILSILSLAHPHANERSLLFLGLVLDFHSKTHSLDSYILSLLESFAPENFSFFPSSPDSLHQVVASGPVASLPHCDKLAKNIRAFLTPGQVQHTARTVLQFLRRRLDCLFPAISSENVKSHKRRKLELKAVDLVSDISAVTFSHSARVAVMALTNLPWQTLSTGDREEVRKSLNDSPELLWLPALTEVIRRLVADVNNKWALQIMAASILRSLYACLDMTQLYLESSLYDDLLKVPRKLVDQEDILPELSIEMYRILLVWQQSSGGSGCGVILDSMFTTMDNISVTGSLSWKGLSSELVADTNGKALFKGALLDILVERWLPLLDAMAPPDQLRQLCGIILGIDIPGIDIVEASLNVSLAEKLRYNLVLAHALRSAEFWELPNLRNSMLSWIERETSMLGTVNPQDIVSNGLNSKLSSFFTPSQLQKVIGIYEKLAYFPPEYFSRSLRADLVKKAIAADLALDVLIRGHTQDPFHCVSSQVVLRKYLKVAYDYVGLVSHSSILLEHLLYPPASIELSPEYLSVTSDLVGMQLRMLARSSQQAPQAFNSIINVFSSTEGTRELLNEDVLTTNFKRRGLLQFINSVITCPHSSLPEECVVPVRTLCENLTSSARSSVSQLLEGDSVQGLTSHLYCLELWRGILSLRQWMQLAPLESQIFGHRLVGKVMSLDLSLLSAQKRMEIYTCVFHLVVTEHHDYPADRRANHTDIVVAAYVSLSRSLDQQGLAAVDSHMSSLCTSMTVADHSHLLGLLLESSRIMKSDSTAMVHLLRLSTMALREAPRGTSKSVQNFATQFVDTAIEISAAFDQILSLNVLAFLAEFVCNRPAAVRPVDLNGIWTLLSKLLVGSPHHDDNTSTITFRQIVTIVAALVRLRRDLVASTLPHLGMILRQLIFALRSVRPQLGGRQRRLVTDTLPSWIDPSQPLGSEEGKVLARTLTGLITKTISRTHHSFGSESAESLSKPFSKHAAFILQAYIDVMDDPLCHLSHEMRTELEPGLFALCDMLNEHTRDALMVSLPSTGGKAILKSLWKDYENQRYIGKG